MDVDAWLAELPAGTIDGWWEYYKLEPWGDDHERTSLLTSTMVNVISSMAPRGERDEAPEPLPVDAFVPFRKHKDPDVLKLKRSLKALDNRPRL